VGCGTARAGYAKILTGRHALSRSPMRAFHVADSELTCSSVPRAAGNRRLLRIHSRALTSPQLRHGAYRPADSSTMLRPKDRDIAMVFQSYACIRT